MTGSFRCSCWRDNAAGPGTFLDMFLEMSAGFFALQQVWRITGWELRSGEFR